MGAWVASMLLAARVALHDFWEASMQYLGRLFSVIALSTATLVLAAVGAPSADAIAQEFTTSTTWTVPAGVSCVTFDLVGAQGGTGGANQALPALPGAPGGLGGEVSVELAVTSSASLTVDVGTAAATARASSAAGPVVRVAEPAAVPEAVASVEAAVAAEARRG